MEFDSIIRVLREMRLLEAFIAGTAIVIFTAAMICLVATVKLLFQRIVLSIMMGKLPYK